MFILPWGLLLPVPTIHSIVEDGLVQTPSVITRLHHHARELSRLSKRTLIELPAQRSKVRQTARTLIVRGQVLKPSRHARAERLIHGILVQLGTNVPGPVHRHTLRHGSTQLTPRGAKPPGPRNGEIETGELAEIEVTHDVPSGILIRALKCRHEVTHGLIEGALVKLELCGVGVHVHRLRQSRQTLSGRIRHVAR